ncbi:MAG: hypothetical protein ACOC3J_04130 [Gemmatimonadota bacterium]
MPKSSTRSNSPPLRSIASGGAGGPEHFAPALGQAGAEAALAAGIFHDGLVSVGAGKDAVREAGIIVR